MTGNKRALLVGGSIALIIAVGLAIGFKLLGDDDSSGQPNGGSSAAQKDVHAQVERAYLGFWKAWGTANETLDPSVLEEAMTGEALDEARSLIEEARTKNEPVRIRVQHDYRIAIVNDATATVDDTFVDRSVRLDPKTKEPTGTEANKSLRNSYTLKKVDGKWKVAEIIAYRSSSPSP